MTRSRRLLANLLTVVVSLVVTLVVAEIVLRLTWDGYYLKQPGGYAQSDPVLSYANRPNLEMQYGEVEFSTTVVHNSFGFRSPEIPVEKPAGVIRIAALGDSFTYGVGVENDETFSAVLERLDPRLQVINTGVNGYATVHQLLMLRDRVLQFDPDIVLVCFFWNDPGGNYIRTMPHFELANGKLVYPPPPVAAPPQPNEEYARSRRPYLRYLFVYRFLSDRLKLLRYHAKLALGLPVEDSGLLQPEQVEPAWALTFELLAEIDRIARDHGARTLLVVIPEQVQVEPDVSVPGLSPDAYEIQDRVLAGARERGIPALDLLPGLEAARATADTPFYYRLDRHFTATGNEVAARLIHADLARRGWLEP